MPLPTHWQFSFLFASVLPSVQLLLTTHPLYTVSTVNVNCIPLLKNLPSGVEFLSTGKWIVIGAMGMGYFWAIGYTALPLLAYLLPNWSHLQIVITLPAIILFLISLGIPESPMWLLTQGRILEAEEILKKIAKVNGRNVPDELDLKGSNEKEKVHWKKIRKVFFQRP